MRAVILQLRKLSQRDFQGVAIAHLTSELGILAWCNILQMCKHSPQHRCIVKHNGAQVHGATRVTVEHGDYIRLELIQIEHDRTNKPYCYPSKKRKKPSRREMGFGPATLLRTELTPNPEHQPAKSHTHTKERDIHCTRHIGSSSRSSFGSWYRPSCGKEYEHPTPKPRRRRTPTRRYAKRAIKAAIMCTLLMTQHCHGAWALQQGHTVEHVKERQHDADYDSYTAHFAIGHSDWHASPVQGLPPPGNPNESFRTGLQITAHGAYLTDRLVQHIEYTTAAQIMRQRLLPNRPG